MICRSTGGMEKNPMAARYFSDVLLQFLCVIFAQLFSPSLKSHFIKVGLTLDFDWGLSLFPSPSASTICHTWETGFKPRPQTKEQQLFPLSPLFLSES